MTAGGCTAAPDVALPNVIQPAPPGEAGAQPPATQVSSASFAISSTDNAPLVSGTLQLVSVTVDDWAVYQDLAAGALYAVPLGGGAPTEIAAQPDRGQIVPGRHVVFAWDSADPSSGVGALELWAPSGGVRQASAAAVLPLVGESADGTHVVFTDHASSDGTRADVILASADLSSRITLLSDVALGDASTCTTQLGFAGDRVFVGACAEGSNSATVTAFDLTGAATILSTDSTAGFSVDDAGSEVLIVDSSGALSVIPLSGGESRLIDSDVAGGVLLGDGSAAVYRTNGGLLRRRDASAASPAVTLASGVESFDELSPDGRQVLFETLTGDQGYTDLRLVPTDGSKSPLVLDSTADGCVFGDPFTTDSARALYVTNIDTTNYTGTLTMRSVDGGDPTVLGTAARIALAAHRGQVVYNDAFSSGSESGIHGRADLHLLDPATGDPAQLLATQADADIALDSAGGRVVYTSTTAATGAGLYVLSL